MNRLSLSLPLLALLCASPLLAQEHMHDSDQEHQHAEGHTGAMEAVVPVHETVEGYLVAAAEQMPEELYGYRPTEEVRTFGQIIGHVANALHMFCRIATGEGSQPQENFENRTTKAGLVEALKMGFDACEAAYAMDDAKAMEEVEFFGNTGSRLRVLNLNVAHNWEHYGNLVVYLRGNGMVPPSSQGGM